jgi:hypothetical protein
MISYKQWCMLNESTFTLGLTQSRPVAPIVNTFQTLEEKKKHMDADPEADEEEWEDEESDEDDDEDGDVIKKKGCGEEDEPSFCSKKMKKKMKNECGCDDKKKPIESDEDMDDEDMDDEEEFDDEEGDDEVEEKDVKRPLGFMKKKMKKGMKKKMQKEGNEDFLQSFNSYVSPKNQMTSEQEFWKSIEGHYQNQNTKYSDGFTEYLEDYLIKPQEQDGQQPSAGEVGFAPQQRMGWFGTNNPEA